ncbi:rhomboid family intramembrane serine protease [Geoalkalibacter halelectricus]|uniref:Rhomboid family intramembrane serine protease n=1 Tax=Geoalkalibacter halelectricus TaxID=2847045 RepID=A0ABY5ZPX5_9BACT|nr:rhomboid family intramembrane serine protease [Geoalkalibacter halelectricus]MDO3376914.1 rhomboid family intramembrane serine protease [Geoalkalibacter halelectricus]UWZ81138.1 rhomboid family intramembrane serine protease [Geoalkalibacter halelectricus]
MTTESPSEDEYEIVPTDILPGCGHALSAGQARTWTLVLEARQVPHRLLRREWGWAICVPAECRQRAEYEIRTYEEKNRNWPPVTAPQQSRDNIRETLCVLLLLAIFHNLILLDPGPLGLRTAQWYEQGAAHVAAIRDGEWWRLLTALTLHTGWRHLAGNLAIGGLFAARLCAQVGTGWGWALILVSGAAGNFLNALMQTGNHRAVGASTAVFGCIGLLCALATRQRHRAQNWRRFLPLAAGAALLAMLGAGGENTDLGAHLFGFLAGIGIGAILPKAISGDQAAHLPFSTAAGLAAPTLLILAWTLALRPIF